MPPYEKILFASAETQEGLQNHKETIRILGDKSEETPETNKNHLQGENRIACLIQSQTFFGPAHIGIYFANSALLADNFFGKTRTGISKGLNSKCYK
jgi:hypothetical protein